MKRLGPACWALAALLPATAHAGPWTKKLGEAYLKLSEGVFIAGEFVDARSRAMSEVDHMSLTTALYAEVGLWDGLHAQLYLPHVAGHNAYSGGYDYLSLGPGDAIAAVQWTPGILPIPHALRLDAKLPLYGLAPDPRFPARGDGQVDVTLWLSAGASLPGLPIYAYLELGHRFRTELYLTKSDGLAFGDSLVFAAQAGLQPAPGWVVAVNLGGVLPYAADDVTKAYLNAGLALAMPLAYGLSLEANGDGTLWANNSSRGLSLGLGVSYKL